MSELHTKHCVPCEGDVPALTPEEIATYLSQLKSTWEVIENKKIRREFRFKSFVRAIQFVDRVADVAEIEDHHPDIHIYFSRVVIELWTHAIEGLSENDFILAAKIEEIV